MTETKKPALTREPPRKDPPLSYTENTPLVNHPPFYEEVDSSWVKPGSMAQDACDMYERERLED